ncbi:MAG: hypothetical protein ACU0BK_05920 [Shimia sp.]|uniref:hypothetical protein n=1 Tax=Shimia sp. TaxID=1954381 RepID=UPI004059B26E
MFHKPFLGMAAAAALSLVPVTAKADPSFGFGISFIFGGDVAVGVRVFSDDEAERGALAVGLDYKLRSKAWRPNIGAAYLDEDFYVDLSLGLDLTTNELDYGIGLGLTSGVDAPAAVAPPPPSPGA